MPELTAEERIVKALKIASCVDGADHKQWVIDQMVRALTGCPMVERTAVASGRSYTYEAQGESVGYRVWVQFYCAGEDGPDTYEWDVGIAP